MRNNRNQGFTLVELLIAVVLMLILTGAVIAIFNRSSDIFAISEAKMDIFQNARSALDIMSREVTSLQIDSTETLEVTNPTSNSGTQTILEFTTITSWENSSGKARVRYEVREASIGDGRWDFFRRIENPDDGNTVFDANDFEGPLLQFVSDRQQAPNADFPDITVDVLRFESGNWALVTGPTFNDPATSPDAIRVTMGVTDRQQREVRTVSRTFWIATNGSVD